MRTADVRNAIGDAPLETKGAPGGSLEAHRVADAGDAGGG